MGAHTALSTLVDKVEQVNASSDTLQLVRRDWWGCYHPAFEPHDPQHLPPHVIAFRLQQEVDEIEDGVPRISEAEITAAMLNEGHDPKGKGKGKHKGKYGPPPH